jgi:hypothetical protein
MQLNWGVDVDVGLVMNWKVAIVTNSGKHSGNYMYRLRCINILRFSPQIVFVCFS